jgi:hypothetical protein
MKFIIFAICLSSISISFAAETSTECPMMTERNDRINLKANLVSMKPIVKTKKGASAQ